MQTGIRAGRLKLAAFSQLTIHGTLPGKKIHSVLQNSNTGLHRRSCSSYVYLVRISAAINEPYCLLCIYSRQLCCHVRRWMRTKTKMMKVHMRTLTAASLARLCQTTSMLMTLPGLHLKLHPQICCGRRSSTCRLRPSPRQYSR